jgi:hypothetical protein
MAAKSTRVDEVSATLTYIGEAPTGASPSQAVWRISRLQILGAETIIQYANGNTNWDNKWDDRASLTYS